MTFKSINEASTIAAIIMMLFYRPKKHVSKDGKITIYIRYKKQNYRIGECFSPKEEIDK